MIVRRKHPLQTKRIGWSNLNWRPIDLAAHASHLLDSLRQSELLTREARHESSPTYLAA
jgi:hypothetical protein